MMKQLMLCGLILLLGACKEPDVSTPAPTPHAIHVTYPSALKPWADKLADCASGNPQVALYFSQLPQKEPDIFSDEISLELGEPSQVDETYSFWQVGNEQVIVVVNTSNPLSELSTDEIRSVFLGQTPYWDGATNKAVQVWVLTPDDPARMVFEHAVLQSQSITSYAMLAPDPAAMLEAISRDAEAIGYLPNSFLITADPSMSDKVKNIQLEAQLEIDMTRPVVAVTQAEPQGLVRELLVCLQSSQP
jgi:hypothetical protein